MNRKEFMGLCVCPGCVVGQVHLVTNERISEKSDKEILILEHSDPTYSIELMRADGVICENGGRLSHICTVAMEMGIPCITQVKNITEEVSEGMYVSLDATNGKVYIFDEE